MISTINQAVIPENILLDRFRSLTIEQQRMLVDFIEFMTSKNSQLQEKETQEISAYDELSEFIGCVDGGSGDLATNKKYL
jgi:hypothetical protein